MCGVWIGLAILGLALLIGGLWYGIEHMTGEMYLSLDSKGTVVALIGFLLLVLGTGGTLAVWLNR